MADKIKAVIIEDEALARDLIKAFLEDFPGIEVCGEYADGYSGVLGVNSLRPDLVFLDIRIPKINGIELAELIDHKPAVIFTTAHDEYALKAFELNAVDYLLKPISKERFGEAVNRALERAPERVPEMREMAKQLFPGESMKRIVVKDREQIHIIPVEDVYYLEAQDDYVMIHLADKRHIKQATMRSFEEGLDSNRFVRVHRSYMVSVDQVARLEQYEKESFTLVLQNGARVPVSRSGYKTLRSVLGL